MLFTRIVIQYLVYFKNIFHWLEINLHQHSHDFGCNQLSRLTICNININALTQSKWIRLNFIFVLIKSSLHTDATLDGLGEWQLLQGSKPGIECTAPLPSLDTALFKSGASVQVMSYQDLWT